MERWPDAAPVVLSTSIHRIFEPFAATTSNSTAAHGVQLREWLSLTRRTIIVTQARAVRLTLGAFRSRRYVGAFPIAPEQRVVGSSRRRTWRARITSSRSGARSGLRARLDGLSVRCAGRAR